MNLAHIWIDRNRDLAIVTATNISGRKADEGCWRWPENSTPNLRGLILDAKTLRTI